MKDRSICHLFGREILDSRGNPTVEAVVTLSDGSVGRASVPSGASTGRHEAHELRDSDPVRYGGKGVLLAVHHINTTIHDGLRGMSAGSPWLVDQRLRELDGTSDKSALGANALLAVSLACAKAAAASCKMPLYRFLGGAGATLLPLPMMNILNGGAHAANNLDIQEFMIQPAGAASFAQGLEWCCRIYHRLGSLLAAQGLSTAVGDEGGYAPNLTHEEEALALILEAVRLEGLTPGQDITLALDAAASGWKTAEGYRLPKRQLLYSTAELISHWEDLCSRYPITSLEDPLGEDDWQGFAQLTHRLQGRVRVVGDDLLVTNTQRIRQGISMEAASAVLLKPNQAGTLTEAMEAAALAQKAGWGTILSHRSGETEDAAIADLAVALQAGQIKAGAPCRGERTAKYNQLLRIEEALGPSARFGLPAAF